MKRLYDMISMYIAYLTRTDIMKTTAKIPVKLILFIPKKAKKIRRKLI